MFKSSALAGTIGHIGRVAGCRGSWGFGVGVEYRRAVYCGPPPVYYDGAPIIVRAAAALLL